MAEQSLRASYIQGGSPLCPSAIRRPKRDTAGTQTIGHVTGEDFRKIQKATPWGHLPLRVYEY